MKHALRKELLKVRRGKRPGDLSARSLNIRKSLFRLPEFKDSTHILFYVSKPDEVSTEHMIKQSIAMEKKVMVPVVDRKRHEIRACELRSWDDLAPGTFNVPEPRPECREFADPMKIELIIVPGVAFDRQGFRIGHGFGFYDKLLSAVKHPKKIGLAYDFQVVPGIPKEDHDVAVDIIVTENEVIKTGSGD